MDKKMDKKAQIIEKRTGGLGSSDARMVAKIGRNGCLSEADRFRIAIMLGIEERKQFSTAATQLGDELEQRIFEALKSKYGDKITSNPYYKSKTLSEKYGFDIFCHIDFEIIKDDEIIWIENKATKESTGDTVERYREQLVWHSILLRERVENKNHTLFLSHYDTSEYDNYGFTARFLQTEFFADESTHYIYKHDEEDIYRGLEIISNEIKSGFQYEKKEELEADCLPEKIQTEIVQVSNILKQIEEGEQKIEHFKSRMLDLMISNSIKSIKNPYFNITVVPKSTSMRFDSKAFEMEHPGLYNQYKKAINKKSYLKITNKI